MNVMVYHPAELADFDPPLAFAGEFERLSRQIGGVAYRTWFRGSKAWVKFDGEIVIDCPTPIRARWIRENCAFKLYKLTGRMIAVIGDAPIKIGTPTHEAWWQANDIKTGSNT